MILDTSLENHVIVEFVENGFILWEPMFTENATRDKSTFVKYEKSIYKDAADLAKQFSHLNREVL